MHRRALPRLSTVSAGVRPALRRYKSSNARLPLSKTKTKGTDGAPVADLLRTVLSPEACELLRGKKKKKGKNIVIEPHPSPVGVLESVEKRKFDAMEDIKPRAHIRVRRHRRGHCPKQD
ncbi:hypothetical protein NUW54_g9357 [Trametes sanguinea]|uniref:Uncharacterized protein n=1 Tax=Trametes sanguinea TaxID=158606 RepID=A0ACC1P7Y4_9APHY|nr:hypothetical protein NUW54_g9357 [Trametes sanguinea]